MNPYPLVSVIVTTRNSESTLATSLESVKNQTYSNIELIVVDNNSTDRTREIATKYGKVYICGPERSTQRNFGAQQSRGHFLLFLDSDLELTHYVIEECVSKVLETGIEAAIVPQRSVGNGFWARCKALEKQCYIGDDLIEAIHFCKRTLYLEVGGFDEEIAGGGEDWDFSFRIRQLGRKVLRVNAEARHHEGNLTLRQTIHKKFYYGKTVMRYAKRHPSRAAFQFLPVRIAFLRNARLMASEPSLSTGLLFMKAAELLAGALGIVSSRFSPAISKDARTELGRPG